MPHYRVISGRIPSNPNGFDFSSTIAKTLLNQDRIRIVEEEIDTAVESRNDSLPTLRELGPPDLVHLVKQSVKSGNKQVSLHVQNAGFSLTDSMERAVSTTMSPESTHPRPPV